jgi:hypothetical protein
MSRRLLHATKNICLIFSWIWAIILFARVESFAQQTQVFRVNNVETKIDINKLSWLNGQVVYIINITNTTGKTEVYKIVKE